MREFHIYDPSEVSFTFRNVRVSGFAEGTFIEVERDEDGFTATAGSLGDVTRTRNLNIMGTITVTLMAQAVSNSYLESIASEDAQFGTGFGAAQAVDHNSEGSEVHATYAWVRKLPKWERGKESGPVVWVFHCADLEIRNNGNAAFPVV